MKKKITYKAFIVALKKKIKLNTFLRFFQDYLHFPDFFQVWKISGQISRLFQGFKTLYEPWLHYTGDNHE